MKGFSGTSIADHPALRWLALVLLSVACVAALEALHLSAARLLGPMIAAIVIAAGKVRLGVPPPLFIFAQAIVGCMVARSMPASILTEVLQAWPVFLVTVVAVIAASVVLGWTLARWKVLPGTTAVWGSLPGAATAMALMAEAFGGDVRLVAFMQYLRVLMVAFVASAVARLWSGHGAAPMLAAAAQPFDWIGFLETLLLAAAGVLVASRLKFPAGVLLLPFVAGAVLQDGGWIRIELPFWLLGFAYTMIGWSIGLRFTRETLHYAARALPRILLAILALIAVCGLLGVALAKLAHVDALTAYLATSPGGADSVAIIATSNKVDVPFVMSMQIARFLLVLIAGPALARLVAKHANSVQGPARL